ncbi:MAG: TspO/MBR family protein [Candidatus Eisenbacteria bacterium]
MNRTHIVKLIVSIVVCQLAGVVGSVFTAKSVSTWYVTLRKPAFTPPGWLFAPVWISLYALMGIALFLVWRKGLESAGAKAAITIFAVQLVLNAAWSVAFFGTRSPLAGLVVIVLLLGAILVTIARFYSISIPAGILLLPYVVWVAFATLLNGWLYVLNR